MYKISYFNKIMGSVIRKLVFSMLLAGMSSFAALAEELPRNENFKYVDAGVFPLYGKATESTRTRYERLPDSYEKVSRESVWFLGRNSAGLYIRFRSNSTAIRARWKSMFGVKMNHMTPTGIRGLDLYTLYDGKWRFVESARPSEDKLTDALVISGMDQEMREYLLYLSLYDGVESLEIGVDNDAYIGVPEVDRPEHERPVIMYGTSILQGGCATRPGMAHTNIIGRRLDREVINLGFSGSALLDYEIAELMASVENPGVFVLDYVPNASAVQIRERGERFFRIIRDAHPDVPVIFVEDPVFVHSLFDKNIRNEVEAKNKEQKALYERLSLAGEKHIYYISSRNMIGDDGEATVDGIHFTDLGMVRYADLVTPVIEKALSGGHEPGRCE